MGVRSPLTELHYASFSIFSMPSVFLKTEVPIVSFTFDDFQHSAAIAGGAILGQYGVHGTYYTAPGLMNKTNRQGRLFDREDLFRVVENGHEVATHTYSHISAKAKTTAEYLMEVERGRAAIQEITGVPDSGGFAYPFGVVTRKVHKGLRDRVTNSRTIWPGLNGPWIRTHLLRANELVGRRDQAENAQQLIRKAKAKSCWAIFYTHDVQATPSRYGCTPGLLAQIIEFSLRCGCRILTVEKMVARMAAQPLSIPLSKEDERGPKRLTPA